MSGIAKNVTLAVVIILAILAGGLLISRSLYRTSESLEKRIVQMEVKARSGDWRAAKEELTALKSDWEKIKGGWAMLIDHIEIDNIETTLSRMTEYIEAQQPSQALAEATVLKQFVRHIPRKEAFRLENIF